MKGEKAGISGDVLDLGFGGPAWSKNNGFQNIERGALNISLLTVSLHTHSSNLVHTNYTFLVHTEWFQLKNASES